MIGLLVHQKLITFATDEGNPKEHTRLYTLFYGLGKAKRYAKTVFDFG